MSTRAEVGLNSGRVLMHLASTTYTDLTRVVIECVQNAIDARAKHIWIEINVKNRSIVVANDGDGVDVEQFEEALRSVGKTQKEENKLGRFGLGLISPLDKCDEFTFTSQPKGEQHWLQWTFNAAEIQDQADKVTIPFKKVSRAKMGGWRQAASILEISRYTKDQTVSKMSPELLVSAIQEKLGHALRRHKVTCYLTFTPKEGSQVEEEIHPAEWPGTQLKVFRSEERDAGEVVFELYLSPTTPQGRKGQVSISERDHEYPITWREFSRQTNFDNLLSPEVRQVLGSGYFEGVIKAERISLHPSRTKFYHTDAITGLAVVIEEWLEKVGRPLFEQEREGLAEKRYQDLSLRTLSRIEEVLREPRYDHLRDVLKGLHRGSVGGGHVDPSKGQVTNKETQPGTRVGRGGAGIKRQQAAGPSPPRQSPPQSERPGDIPLVAHGPSGRRRQVTRNNSGGLAFSHAMPEGEEQLWRLDAEQGILYFNVRHPVWLRVDDSDSRVMHLQEWLALQALSLLLQPEGLRDSLQNYVDAQAPMYVDLMIVKGHTRSRNTKSRATTPSS